MDAKKEEDEEYDQDSVDEDEDEDADAEHDGEKKLSPVSVNGMLSKLPLPIRKMIHDTFGEKAPFFGIKLIKYHYLCDEWTTHLQLFKERCNQCDIANALQALIVGAAVSRAFFRKHYRTGNLGEMWHDLNSIKSDVSKEIITALVHKLY